MNTIVHVHITWTYRNSKKVLTFDLDGERTTLGQLKALVMERTGVSVEKQKFLGLKRRNEFLKSYPPSMDNEMPLLMFISKMAMSPMPPPTSNNNSAAAASRIMKLQLVGTPERDMQQQEQQTHVQQERAKAAQEQEQQPKKVAPVLAATRKKVVLTPGEQLNQVAQEVTQTGERLSRWRHVLEEEKQQELQQQEADVINFMKKHRQQLIMFDEFLIQKMIQLDSLDELEGDMRLRRKQILQQIQAIQSEIDQLKSSS